MESKRYFIAFVKISGVWDVVDEFRAFTDQEANKYAESKYDGQEWHVIDETGRNINNFEN